MSKRVDKKKIFTSLKELFEYISNKRINFINHKYNTEFKSRNLYYLVGFIFIFTVVFGVFLFNDNNVQKYKIANVNFKNKNGDNNEEKIINRICNYQRAIDGECVNSKDEAESKLFAVMVENHFEARPLSGVSQANLVYEALVEGGITRFMLIFGSEEEIDEIGPVRSARPYYLTWAKELGAMYVHVGGSPEALLLIKKYNIMDFDEYFKGPFFWRSNERYAPHNTYISSENLKKGKEKYFLGQEQKFTKWQFKEGSSFSKRGNDGQKIIIDYSSPLYEVEWEYNKEKNIYLRYTAGRPYTDSAKNQITVKNIAVMFTETAVIDEIGRKEINVVGSGDAEIYLDGKRIMGSWEKNSLNERTMFYDSDGKEIIFNQGKIWINVVPTYLKIVYNNSVKENNNPEKQNKIL